MMTIAQALRRIKKLKGRMAELTARAAGSVSHLVDKKPAFDFQATRQEIGTVREELIKLEAAVTRANATAKVEYDGRAMTISEAVRRLQEIKAEIAWLAQLSLREGTEVRQDVDYDALTGRNVVRKIETTFVTALAETQRVAEIDALRDRFERLNDAVESANHRTSVE